ncbi:dihydrolipoamide acetyltransferase family protein [Geofilum rubicundum]|uniref:Dihydrolipoamide acetyltransferase component of pyruvate dehydrogenase complex n=1 Tax=Geofilum rubicundum JCM 15548 TaxID=1236989 RepID=A0A0E9LZW6_9BACT|nr:dihydrolipoamide acetyltransferase family protein [Geofilum rubicundum]GAO30799.1 dihydrolipoamide acetyltransferase component of pyruvate dehydrogenase complex [Geofilum rubicundum JCM 15548]
MIKEIKLPEIADNVDSAVVLNIHVSKGDKIKKEDTIAEMESDKAAFDLPSDVAGEVMEIKVSEGDEVKVGQVVITVETEGGEDEESQDEKDQDQEKDKPKAKKKSDQQEEEEQEEEVADEKEEEEDQEKEKKGEEVVGDEQEEDEQDDAPKKKSAEKNKKKTSNKKASEEEGQTLTEEEEAEGKEAEEEEEVEAEDDSGSTDLDDDKEVTKSENVDDDESDARKEAQEPKHAEDTPQKKEVAAAPSIRRLARELGIDIYKVEGTGPHDRISAEDVKSYSKMIAQKSKDPLSAQADEALPNFSQYGSIERQPLNSIRKRIAKNVQASWQTIPHVFQFDKADISQLETFLDKYGKEGEKEGVKLTITAILLKILAQALKRFPNFNASLDMKNEEIILKKYFNIGVAVDTDRGLLVPVIKDVDKKSILELSQELGEMAERTRNKKIKPDELQGGNIALSNLGGIGGTNFTPIVYSPNVAILGVSQARTEPVYIDGAFQPRQILPLSLSYDHRAIDGAEGARFLRWFCEALENPLLTLL